MKDLQEFIEHTQSEYGLCKRAGAGLGGEDYNLAMAIVAQVSEQNALFATALQAELKQIRELIGGGE